MIARGCGAPIFVDREFAHGVGSPIVTWPGPFLRGRITAAMFARLGLKTGLPSSCAEYIRQAVDLGRDQDRRPQAQRDLREVVADLFENPADVVAFAESLEQSANRG